MDFRNSSWETIPTYMDLFHGMADFVFYFWKQSDQLTPAAHLQELWNNNQFIYGDLKNVIFLAMILTSIRHLCTFFIFKPLCKSLNLLKSSQEKMPESAWKFTFYLLSSSYAFYLVTIKNKFFQQPELMWHNWSFASEVPTDIYLLLVIQMGFYLHSVYATLFLDTWRKDSMMLIVHHFVTLMLLFYSLAFRYHNIGALILLFHDITDIGMEFSKLNIYFKIQSGELVKFHETLSNAAFMTFAFTWVISRLYWFPLKAIYGLTVTTARLDLREKLPVLAFVTFLLWFLFTMNLIWFKIIFDLLVRILTGQMKAIDDTREYDVAKKVLQRLPEHQNGINGHYVNRTTQCSTSSKTIHRRVIQENGK